VNRPIGLHPLQGPAPKNGASSRPRRRSASTRSPAASTRTTGANELALRKLANHRAHCETSTPKGGPRNAGRRPETAAKRAGPRTGLVRGPLQARRVAVPNGTLAPGHPARRGPRTGEARATGFGPRKSKIVAIITAAPNRSVGSTSGFTCTGLQAASSSAAQARKAGSAKIQRAGACEPGGPARRPALFIADAGPAGPLHFHRGRQPCAKPIAPAQTESREQQPPSGSTANAPWLSAGEIAPPPQGSTAPACPHSPFLRPAKGPPQLPPLAPSSAPQRLPKGARLRRISIKIRESGRAWPPSILSRGELRPGRRDHPPACRTAMENPEEASGEQPSPPSTHFQVDAVGAPNKNTTNPHFLRYPASHFRAALPSFVFGFGSQARSDLPARCAAAMGWGGVRRPGATSRRMRDTNAVRGPAEPAIANAQDPKSSRPRSRRLPRQRSPAIAGSIRRFYGPIPIVKRWVADAEPVQLLQRGWARPNKNPSPQQSGERGGGRPAASGADQVRSRAATAAQHASMGR